ncbi:response regulator [Corallococcus coralloides DSM 2259]|uniref:Response regulator n=1 Tax=Corallococcus coralloides (strain ATCC 25202 / DSM 2259 / NBRC 100086 / M2) TaxID=1144275 RepID=H8MHX8_CORCM|nr:response regulator [Corallococcus coralloides]AFE05165.1 response regulator [Corallococcus coralloides DSM 2259]
MARLLIVEDNQELASLIATVAETRGHEALTVFTGESALEALGPHSRFDAALVDLLLPDIRGSEVLGALRAHGIPAIAVSGVYKGDRFAQEATQVHGACAFFEKPFELDSVISALEEAAGVPPVTHGELLDEVDLLVLEELVQETPSAEEEPALASVLSPSEPSEPAPPEEAPGVSEALPLPFAQRDAVWTEAAPAPVRQRRQLPEWSLGGDLGHTSVPRLLNAYYEARHHGELKLRQGTVLKVVYFEAGRVVYAASNLAPERFGRFCLRKGALTEAQLAEATGYAREHSLRTGDALLKRGLLSPKQRRQLLEEQVKDILWSTFAWTEGGYGFSPMRPQRADLVPLSLFPGDLILEGVTRTETLVALRQRMALGRRLFPTADPPYGLHELKLAGPQAMLLAFADGTKTVEDLLALTDLSEREALATLRGLELSGVLEERQQTPNRRQRISFGL